MIEKVQLEKLRNIIQEMRNCGQCEKAYVAEWVSMLLTKSETDGELSYLAQSLDELNLAIKRLQIKIEGIMSLAERFPEFRHLDTGVQVAYCDFSIRDTPYTLGVSSDCVVLYKACMSDVLQSDDTETLEVWCAEKPDAVLSNLVGSNLPISPYRVFKCYESYRQAFIK